MTVYRILEANNLCQYYELNSEAGIKRDTASATDFAFLDLPEVQTKLLDFSDGNRSKVTFFIPAIHCSSCIWLLENLYVLDKHILSSRVNFLRKEVSIYFDTSGISLRKVAETLASIGYEPYITLESTDEKQRLSQTASRESKDLIVRIAVAGFCMGNIMLLSFPAYFGFDSASQWSFRYLFSYLNIALSLPSLFYSGWIYLRSAYQSLRKGIVNLDLPLALGMVVLFVRSLYEILWQGTEGYLDTLAGLVFFLLVGKWFQQRTYHTLRYDRDFKSYFPVAVLKKFPDGEKHTHIAQLSVGDRILIRHNELIPADSVLIEGEGLINYSFVTGESTPIPKTSGQLVYAGGRQEGGKIELEVVKPTSQSYLTQLWEADAFAQPRKESEKFQSLAGKYFTYALLAVAFMAGGYWAIAGNMARAINSFSAVLIIACPCALALSSPFALGTAMNLLAKHKFYVRAAGVIEDLARINTVVFDKTGTITESRASHIVWQGEPLQNWEKAYILRLVSNSTHPLSIAIQSFLEPEVAMNWEKLPMSAYTEIQGKGISATVNDVEVRIGSAAFVGSDALGQSAASKVHIAIAGTNRGFFAIQNKYRKGIAASLQHLKTRYTISLLSGDSDAERERLVEIFGNERLHFDQSPADKLTYIQNLQQQGSRVLMVGDGLNDAGALRQADVGIAVSENIAYFTPASDAVLDAGALALLPGMLAFSRHALKVIYMSFGISLVYNTGGLIYAVQGTLSPVLAAILMPVSSLTIILFTTLAVAYGSDKIRA